VTVTLIFVTVATLLAAILREVRRRDLIILSGMLIGGVVADAILAPSSSTANSIRGWSHCTCCCRSRWSSSAPCSITGQVRLRTRRAPRRSRSALSLDRPTALDPVRRVTDHGHHDDGLGAARRLVTGTTGGAATTVRVLFGGLVHSLAAVLFIGLITGLLFAIWTKDAPSALRLGVRRLVIISLVQAAIGVTQYLTHVPPLLVELHVAGAVSLTIGVTQFHLKQSAHDREPGTRRLERGAEPSTLSRRPFRIDRTDHAATTGSR